MANLFKVTVYQRMTYLVLGSAETIASDVMDPLKRIAFVGEGAIHKDVVKGCAEATIDDMAEATPTMANVKPEPV